MRHILLVLLFSLALPFGVAAQSWHVTPNTHPMPPNTSLLPYSITNDYIVPAPWVASSNGTTWYAIWPRNASGAWYRPNGYSQPGIHRDNVYAWAYHCYVHTSTTFRCRDLVRQIDRYVSCPANINIGWLRRWRSQPENAAWPEYALYETYGTWNTNWNQPLYLNGNSVVPGGQRSQCQYGPLTSQGPGMAFDTWLWRP